MKIGHRLLGKCTLVLLILLIAFLFSGATAASPPESYLAPLISVTSPIAGGSWMRGTTQTIEWVAIELSGQVYIELYVGGVYDQTLGLAPATDGQKIWDVPSDIEPRTDYEIHVRQTSIMGTSGPFSIIADVNGGTWTKRSPSSYPPLVRACPAMAYDEARNEVVLFGGMTGISGYMVYLQDTWIWNGTEWSKRFPANMPPGRWGHAMAYDPLRNEIVMFGGMGEAGAPSQDTWAWNGEDWTNRASLTTPSQAVWATMAYDRARSQVVLYGAGSNDCETWTWDGTDWAQQLPAHSPSLFGSRMAYDAARNEIVLFGGTLWMNVSDQTWIWNGMNWEQKYPEHSPEARGDHAMSFISSREEVVLVGGFDTAGSRHDTWVWDGSDWIERIPTNPPSERYQHAMAYDVLRDEVVMFGGVNSDSGGATWIYTNREYDPFLYPSVAIKSPTDGMIVVGVVPIQVDAFDQDGISKVEIYVDDVLITADTTYPYGYGWNTSGLVGAHTIKAVSYDVLNLTAVAQITVYVVDELPPSITVHPLSQIIASGQTALLTVEASGTEPLAYQWYRGATGDTSEPISGANSSSYAAFGVTSSSSYWVGVSNAYGDAASNTAVITIGLPSKLVGKVYDITTKAGIPGATIALGDYPPVLTDGSGHYEIPNLSPGDYSLVISSPGYSTFSSTIGISISSTITKNFFLTQSLSGAFYIDSLTSKYTGFVYYLDDVSFFVTYTAHVYWGPHPPGLVRFIMAENRHYDVPTSGDTASHEFNIQTDFSPCGTLKAVAISADGSRSEIKNAEFTVMPLPLARYLFDKHDKGNSFYYQTEWSELELIDLAVDDNVIPEDIPLFGRRGFDFKSVLPLTVEAKSSGQVDADLDISSLQYKYKDKAWADGRMAGFRFTLTPRLNLTGQYSYPECRYHWEGNLGLNGEFKIEKSWPFILPGPVPAPMYAKATFDLTVDASLKIPSPDPVSLEGDLNLYPYVRGSVGAGFNRLLAIEGWLGGGGEFLARFPETPHLHDLSIYINVGVTVYGLLFKWETGRRWDWAMNGGATQTSISDQTAPVTAKQISRQYLSASNSGRFLSAPVNRQASASAESRHTKISSALLQESVYPYSDPFLSYQSGLLGLTWLQDDPARLAINRTIAMSSIYDGTAWSTPVAIGDDGTADFHPQHLMFDGGNAVAVWEDEKVVHPETATFEDMVANLEISASAYDPISGAWLLLQRLTDNSYYDGSPLISGPSVSNLMLTWTSNEANDLMGSPSAPNKLWYSLYNGATWSMPQQAAEIPIGILKYSLVYNGTAGHIVLSVDTDGDSTTVADNEFYRLTYTGGSWGALTRFTEDSLPDVNPKLTFDPTGHTVLVWMKGNELSCSVDFATPTVIYTDEFSTNLADFKMAASSGGRIALLWSKPAEYNSDLNVLFYDPAYQTWGNAPHQITFDPEIERNLAVTFYGANELVAAYDRTPVETTTLTQKTASGKMVTLDVPQLGTTDLYILDYTMGRDLALGPLSLQAYPVNPEPGAGVTLTVTVMNAGDETAVSAPVAFYLGDPANGGTLISEEYVAGNLVPGGQADVSRLWEVPETTVPLTIYAVADPSSAFDTEFRTNNTVSIEIVKPDLAINGVDWEWLGSDKVLVTAMILNAGVIPTQQTTVRFRQDSNSGRLISDEVLPALAKGELRDVTIEWDVSALGFTEYPICVSLDEENLVPEYNEGNNSKLMTVTRTVLLDAILVMSPNGGETWPARTVQPIQWATSGIVGDVRIEYSTDGGSTFEEIVIATPNDGSYEWTVENVSSATCLVRVSETDGVPTDTSDAAFTIAGVPEIAVTSPNGGERWTVGSTHEVTWTAAALSGTVTVDLYKGGVKIRTLGTPEAADGSLSWTIDLDETPGADYRVLIWQDSVSDDSDADFAVVRTVRVDFNMDGQEDLLWRYYGEGGHNRAWFLANTEAAGLPQPTSDPCMDLTRRDKDLREKMIKRGLSDPQGMGLSSGRPANVPDIRALMGDRTVPMTVDDPRKAGRGMAAPSRSGLMDPRQAGTLVPSRSAPAAVAASVPSIIGGADVMAVGDVTWQVVGMGDFDNDTHVDILWRNSASGINVVWFMNGTEWVSSAELLPVGDLTWQIAGTGDFNNDTHVDILWRNSLSGENVVWNMNGTTWIGSAVLLGVSDQTWQIVGTGDFNKDGKVDMLWRYTGPSGYNVVWHMDNATWTGSAELIPVGDTAWQIAGTGDYNNDGNVDILWRYNGSGGYNVIWYLNGVNWSSSAELIPVPDLNWRIVSR